MLLRDNTYFKALTIQSKIPRKDNKPVPAIHIREICSNFFLNFQVQTNSSGNQIYFNFGVG